MQAANASFCGLHYCAYNLSENLFSISTGAIIKKYNCESFYHLDRISILSCKTGGFVAEKHFVTGDSE